MKTLFLFIVLISQVSIAQNESKDLYAKIRVASLSDELDSSFQYAKQYIDSTKSIDSLSGFIIDTDLARLRASAYGLSLDSLVFKKYSDHYQNIKQPHLGFQLWKFGVIDQKTRTLRHFLRVDSFTLKNPDSIRKEIEFMENYIIEHLKENTLLSNSIVGAHGAKGAWLVIQHSGNVKYLKLYSKCLKKALSNQDIDPRLYAKMKDRLLIIQGKKQIYGTQAGKVSATIENGIAVATEFSELAPTKGSEAKINERRNKIGLEPLKDDPIWELMKEMNENVEKRLSNKP